MLTERSGLEKLKVGWARWRQIADDPEEYANADPGDRHEADRLRRYASPEDVAEQAEAGEMDALLTLSRVDRFHEIAYTEEG